METSDKCIEREKSGEVICTARRVKMRILGGEGERKCKVGPETQIGKVCTSLFLVAALFLRFGQNHITTSLLFSLSSLFLQLYSYILFYSIVVLHSFEPPIH